MLVCVLYTFVLNIILFVTYVISFFNLTQSDYQVRFDWAEVIRYNEQYVKYVDFRVYKFNRSTTAANLTAEYNADMGRNLEVVVQAYKFASNEYRVFPIRFQVNFCEALDKNLIGAKRMILYGNFSGCPLWKGERYHSYNWVPDQFEFPPLIPNSKYKVECQMFFRSKEIWVGAGYGEVFRPIVKK